LGLRSVTAFSVIGEDAWGAILQDRLAKGKISTRGLLKQAGRHTPTYIKPILMGYDSRQEDARLDFENLEPLSSQVEEVLLKAFEDQLDSLEAVLISDQLDENGIITPQVRQQLIALAERHPQIRFLVDSRQRIGLFQKMILKPNRLEALAAFKAASDTGHPGPNALEKVGRALSSQTHQPVFLTLGDEGVLVCEQDECQVIAAAPVRGSAPRQRASRRMRWSPARPRRRGRSP
jgi:bifunctional ADP-heptose synthase (sugar kinase/adenylyltransferase)